MHSIICVSFSKNNLHIIISCLCRKNGMKILCEDLCNMTMLDRCAFSEKI